MEEKKKINFKELAKNTIEFSNEKYKEAKNFTTKTAMPKLKETAISTKNKVTKVTTDISNKVKTTITEEQIKEVLDKLYIQAVDGIPKVSLPIDDLVNDYTSKHKTVEETVKALINNSMVKCGTSGFLTGLGGLLTMVATLPANITSVIYVQLRMSCAIAKIGGYDIHSDQVQTLIYACLTGSAASDVLKHAGITFGNKFGTALVKKIPGKTLQAINQKVGFRFMTKFGSKGIINLGSAVPIIGGVIGGSIDVASTKIIGDNVYKIFVKGEAPSNEKEEDVIIHEAEFTEIDDIDTKMIKENLKD